MPRKQSYNNKLWQQILTKMSEYSVEEIDMMCGAYRYKQKENEARKQRAKEERQRKEEERRVKRENKNKI